MFGRERLQFERTILNEFQVAILTNDYTTARMIYQTYQDTQWIDHVLRQALSIALQSGTERMQSLIRSFLEHKHPLTPQTIPNPEAYFVQGRGNYGPYPSTYPRHF